MRVTDRLFTQGYATALAQLIRERDEPSMAVDMAQGYGLSAQDFVDAGVDDFDLKPILKAFEDEK